MTTDEKALVSINDTFLKRIEQTLKEKAQYWTNSGTPARADVNVQMQKRKRYASLIFNSDNFAHNSASKVGNFWLTGVSNPALDENGIPTAAAINDNFDPTYDYFAGIVTADATNTEITW